MKQIYYKYAGCNDLEPISGDRITELMNIMAFAEAGFVVRYGTQKKDNIDSIAYVRANEQYFKAMAGIPRIWFASPYNQEMMRQCDRIATFTDTWTRMLSDGEKFSLNPNGIAWGKKVMTIPQTIEPMFFKHKTLEAQEKEMIICVTGRMARTTYPATLVGIWPKIKKKFGAHLFVASNINSSNNVYDFPKDAKIGGVNFVYMPSFLSLMSVMIAGQHGEEWDYCGNMKILEAAAVGLPVIMERSRAREEDFGEDYPFFVPRGAMTNPNLADHIIERLELLVKDPHIADNYLKRASEKHNIRETSKIIAGHLNKLI